MTDQTDNQAKAIATGAEQQTQLPVPYAISPLGSTAAAKLQIQATPQEKAEMMAIAQEILADPLALRLLSDRVYALMQADLRQQRDRSHGYGGRH